VTVADRPAVAWSRPAARRLVAALRLAAIPAWTAACFLVWIVAGLGPRTRRRPVVRAWAAGLLRVLAVRVTQHGVPPAGPFLLVANHLGYLDVLVLASRLDAVFVAKADVRQWPLLGPLAATTGTIFIDRSKARDVMRVGGEMRTAWQRGDGVVLFPEGTSTDGRDVLPLRTALLEWARAAGRPVHASSIAYRTLPGDPPARTAVCWWGDMTFVPHLQGLCALRGVRADIAFTAPLAGEDRRALAAAARDTIRLHLGTAGDAH
jgi:1-acyl-sn-glycerol-3-phosphate acyltransferase